MRDLLEAVDALTKPVRVLVPQDDGVEPFTTRLVHAPLLEQFRAEIFHSTGSGGGGGASSSERAPIDFDMFTLYELIDGKIRSWEYAPRKGDLVDTLRKWYSVYQVHATEPEPYLSELRSFKTLIESRLDGGKRLELMFPCPSCGVEVYVRDDTRARALTCHVMDPANLSWVNCAVCGERWEYSRLQELQESDCDE